MKQSLAARFFLGEDYEGKLPDRVVAVIDRQQEASEIIIAWAQALIVAIWTTLYTVAPKTFSADTTFEPVPWALGAYAAFSVLRLVLAHRRALRRWFLALSVIVDMAILMTLIWSFHLQYEQPAAFYLKAPTLLYVFIFIALRALRFDPWFVILAGVAAATGWLSLVLYAVSADPADNMITRDYVAYVTSNKVLLGAEFDKVISIVLVTLILALALVRARRLLVRAIAEESARSDLSRFFSPEVSQRITQSEHRIRPGHGELRHAAILYADVRGFTVLAMRTPPDELMTLLAEYEARMVAVIKTHGGVIDKFLGDGIMATFGATSPSQSFAADALRSVEGLMDTARRWADERRAAGLEPLDIRFSVASGPVVFGAVGDESRLEYTVIGDAVNLAAKLDQQTKVENAAAIATAEALEEARRQGYVPAAAMERRDGRTVMGLAHPVDLVVFLS